MNRKTGIDIHTLSILCIKQITNENILHGTGNSTWFSVLTSTGTKSKKGDICMCMADSLCFTVESDRAV